MNTLKIILVLLLAIAATGAQAQTATPTPYVFTANTAWEFESTTANMSYSGTWATVNFGAASFRRGSNGASLSFWIRAGYLMIYRTIDSSFSGSIEICISSVCTSYSSNYAIAETAPIIIALPDSTNNYQVSLSGNYDYMYLDYFVVLSESSSFVVPTATAITFPPTPTAITFPTPYPTPTAITFPTPYPTPTAITLPTTAPDVSVYATLESGQMTKFEYSADAADVHISNLLIAIFVSVWGMFIIFVFVVWRVDKR